MNVIHAVWDDRNLGRTCYEISLQADDSIERFTETEQRLISEEGAQYLVVKTPVNTPHMLYGLRDLGYTFLETAFQLALKKQNYVCPAFVKRFDRDASVRTLHGPTQLGRVFEEINKGMFETDRVAIDRKFGRALAARRYVNWVGDIATSELPIHEVWLKDEPLGFFVLKPVDHLKMRGILTGLYGRFARSGFGVLLMKKLNDTVWAAGYTTYLAQVTSNNTNALRSNLLFGSEVEMLTYNYIKHVNT